VKQPTPVTVVSGFLGSGKTTLLCGLLQRRQERRLAVLINELGEVSIDGALARAAADASEDIEILDFPNGLIAYAEDSRFVPALQDIARRAERIDCILIETSGVALPSAVMARLQSPELAEDFVLDATLVVVDTPRLLAGQFHRSQQGITAVAESVSALFDQQLASADVVVLNKIDELDTDALLAAEEQIRSRAPNVRFLELAHQGSLDVRLALGLRLHQAMLADRPSHFHGPFTPLPGVASRTLADHGRVDGHSHSGLMAHTHGLATHTHFHEQDPGWLSFVLRSAERQNVSSLRDALEHIAATEPLLRCKGIVLSDVSGEPVLFQGVRTRVVTSGTAPVASAPETSELVFIGYHLARLRMASMLTHLTGTVWS
jgi:cobalamin biosynthesis protein CobW